MNTALSQSVPVFNDAHQIITALGCLDELALKTVLCFKAIERRAELIPLVGAKLAKQRKRMRMRFQAHLTLAA